MRTEEISDMMTPKSYIDRVDGQYVFRKGKVLKFNYEGSITSLKITKIDRKNQRMWAVQINLHDQRIVVSHYGHSVDTTGEALEKYGSPWCEDCEIPVTEPSTEDGDRNALDRRDDEERNVLSDGTRLDED